MNQVQIKAGLQEVLVHLPDDKTITELVSVHSNIWDIHQRVAVTLGDLPGSVILTCDNKVCDPATQIEELVRKRPRTALKFEATTSSANVQETEHDEVKPKLTTLQTRVFTPWQEWEFINVLVENRAYLKEWCGGYRDKRTGKEYHNAGVQALQRNVNEGFVVRGSQRDRLVQTPVFPIVSTGMETDHTMGTQTFRNGLYIPTHGDRILEVGDFTPQEVYELDFIRKVILIQRLRRRCLDFLQARKEREAKEKQKKLAECVRQEVSATNRMNILDTAYVADRSGFENMYRMVDNWYENEKNKLLYSFKSPTAPNYRHFLLDLFNKKVSLLKYIEKIRIKYREEFLRRKKMNKFVAASTPMIRFYDKGNVTVVESHNCQRAREFKEIYISYIKKDYTKEERLNMLLDLKKFFETFELADLAIPLIELLKREIDLTAMDVKHLEGLQKRISEHMYYILTHQDFELPGFRSTDDMPLVTYRCPSCMQLKPPSGFLVSTSLNSRYCTSCSWLLDRNFARPGLGPFMLMLERVRDEEDLTTNYIPLLMKPQDVRALVMDVWFGSSALSGNADPADLRLPKWRKNIPWSPWNCILLNIEEAEIHKLCDNVETSYNNDFITKIQKNHINAARLFKNLKKIDFVYKDRERHVAIKLLPKKKEEILNEIDPFFVKEGFLIRSSY